ncbi:hypothetical protein CTA1_4346 [Colletotrichum tanaceti]|uniref:Transmembrane protein n=1 Tax=Colletotrichum tanaceti TaxID=1306861 RepID=A0A4U6XD60_9PEZI|nr:hypothetical protein CTA1_4346 [Colletotrichum tanaceti]
MAPIPDNNVVNADNAEAVAASVLHQLARRDQDKSRTAGWIVGLLVAGCIILALIYFCLDDAFGMKPRKGKKDHPPRARVRTHHHHSHHRHHGHLHTHTHTHTHRHRNGTRHQRHGRRANRRRSQSDAAARHSQHASQDTGSTVRLLPPHIAAAMPVFPPAAAPPAAGAEGEVNVPPPDAFVDYGPAPDQDLRPAWDVDPDFRLEQLPVGRDGGGGGGGGGDRWMSPLFAGFRRAPRGAARDPRREAAGERQRGMNDDEMEAA